MIGLKDITSKPAIIRLAMLTSQHVPPSIGHRVSWLASGVVSRLRPTIYEIARANLSQVLGPGVQPSTLEETVRRVFYTTIRGYYDLFRTLHLPRPERSSLVDLPEQARSILRSLWNREGGSVMVFAHLGNFDLGGQALGTYLPETQLLTLPDPPAGFEFTNKLRQLSGIKVTPLSSSALRQAIKLLRRGGVVSLAGDRPVSELDEPVSFFGQPARLPSGHVRLALKTGAVIVIAYCILSESGRYIMQLEPPLEMIRTGDRDEEFRLNMRRVLDALEAIIRRWPDQWQMFVPVWPALPEA